MSSQTPPTAVLVVHGGYFLPPAWAPFIEDLKSAGFTVSCPRLPTCGDERPPKALLSDDVAAVRTAANELVEAGHSILVLCHSYGGIVASEAIQSDLYAKDNNGKGVVRLVYLSSWLVQPGDSLMDVVGKHGFLTKVDLGQNDDGTVFAKNAPDSFYNDIERSRAEELATHNVTHNWLAVSGKVLAAPWKDLPTTYIHCERDLAIELPLQKDMVKDAIAAAGSAKLETVSLDTGHCPFLSNPEALMQIVKSVSGRGS